MVGLRQLMVLIAASVLPALLITVAVLDRMLDDARRNAESNLMQAAQALALSVDQRIGEETAALSMLANAPALDSDELKGFRALAERAVEQRESWLNVILADRDHQLVNTRTPPATPLPSLLSSGDIAGMYDTGRNMVSGVERAPDRYLHPFIRIGTPVVREGTVRYALLAKLPAWTFHTLLRVKVAAPGQAALLDRHGRVIALSASLEASDPLVGAPARSLFLGGADGAVAGSLPDGRKAVTVQATAPVSGWRVALVQPAESLEEPLSRLSLLLTGASMLAAALAGVAAVLLVQWLRRARAAKGKRAARRRLADIAAHAPGLLHRHTLLPDGTITVASMPGTSFSSAGDRDGDDPLPLTPRMADALRASAATLSPLCLDQDVQGPMQDPGGVRWLRSVATPRRMPDGSVVWDGMSIDVTDLRQAEAAVRDNESRLRMAQEAAGMGSWDWDPSSNRILWSDGMYRILDVDPGNAPLDIGAFVERRVHPDDRQMVLAESQRASLRAGPLRIEYRIIREDGSIRWLESTGNSVANADGRSVRLLGIVRDTTERRRMEEALHAANTALEHEVAQHRRTEALLESIYATAPAGMCVVDQQLRYLHINDHLAAINGRSAADHIGRSLRDILPQALAESLEPLYRRVLLTGEPLYDCIAGGPAPCAPQTVSHYALNLHPLRQPDGTVYAVNAIVQDVTGRRAMEEALRAALEDARAANAAKARFFAAASHDLRQPVQTLFLFTHALGERLRDHPAQALVSTMQQALEGLKTLIDTLLDISRLDSGALVAEPADFPAVTLMQRLSAEYTPRMAAKGLKFRMVGNPVWVRSDSVLLGRILGNLLDNALKYTEQGGVLLSCRRRGNTARIEVWDTGAGIAPEDQAAIFDEFVQVGPARHDRSQGLGLGLSIVQRLAALLGHELSLRSVPGRGSVFSVTVPLAAESVDSVRPPPLLVAADKGGPPLAVMLDDDATILTALGMLLEEWGFETIGAATPEDVLAQIAQRRRRPDVIVADYFLPGGRTGTDAIRQIRAYCNAPVPSIVLTGDTGPERALEVGRIGSHLLQKPVMPDMLQDMVHRLAGLPKR